MDIWTWLDYFARILLLPAPTRSKFSFAFVHLMVMLTSD